MTLWDRVRGWVDANSQRLTLEFIPDDGGDFEPHRSYLRVWLADAALAKERRRGADRHPAIHAAVRLTYAGRPALELTSVLQPGPEDLVRGPRRNLPLTPLLPYAGGVVEVEAGLSELVGDNALGTALSVLQSLSGLLVPPLGEAAKVAQTVAGGLQSLLDVDGGGLVLGVHDGFGAPGAAGAPPLRSGHMVCVGAPAGTLDLTMAGGRLCASGRPLEGHDMLVFRLERRSTRDDWRHPSLEALLARATDALYAGDRAAFDAFRRAAAADALKSPDLTVTDRQRVARAIIEELREVEGIGLGASGEPPRSLAEIVEGRALSEEEVRLRPAASLEELLDELGG